MILPFLFLFVFGNCLTQSQTDNFKLLLLHTNDIHGRFEEVNRDSVRCEDKSHRSCYGGVGRVRAAVDKYRAEAHERGIPSLYLDAGDIFQGSMYYSQFKWHLAAKMVDLLRPNVMTLGNHEFDDHITGLIPFLRRVKVPIVCCNIDVKEEPIFLKYKNLMPSKILTVNGRKVGVLGYLTRDITKGNIGKLKILDEITSVRKEARRLKRLGVDIIIALGHSGYDKDKQVAKEVEEIDVIVGGHSHTFLHVEDPSHLTKVAGPYPTQVTQASGKKVLVVQTSAETKYLGYLLLEFDKKGDVVKFSGVPKLLSGDMPRFGPAQRILNPYSQIIVDKYRRVIGTTEVLLEGDSAICKFRECNLGNMIADAFVEYVAKHHRSIKGWPLATMAVIHSGGIKSSLHPKSDGYSGEIVLEDLMTMLPFASELVILRLPGSVIREGLERSVRRYTADGIPYYTYLIQVSGLRITYDLSRKEGDQVVDVQVRCEECDTPTYSPLKPDQTYGVIMPKFIARRGDPYTMLKSFKFEPDLKVRDYDVVSQYIAAHSPITGYKNLEGRITNLADTKSKKVTHKVNYFTPRLKSFSKFITVSYNKVLQLRKVLNNYTRRRFPFNTNKTK